MARRDDVLGVTGAETVIGAGVTIEGSLISEADISIDGTMHGGDIKTTGDLTIGVNAKIKANIWALNISVAGELDGSIIAEGEATIRETGRVTGDITSAGLAIVSGGIFSGRSIVHRQRELDLPRPDDTEPERRPPVKIRRL
ncbi:MAG TPA: polymer-forming cytoskeletal protein [Candidatus Saccharimonadia bacterium]|nr:polymer-forming cytoskeletal protein [Candidatus Saccharimonadia bacterium]